MKSICRVVHVFPSEDTLDVTPKNVVLGCHSLPSSSLTWHSPNGVIQFDEKRKEIPNTARGVKLTIIYLWSEEENTVAARGSRESKEVSTHEMKRFDSFTSCRRKGTKRASMWINNQFERQWTLEFFNQRQITTRKSCDVKEGFLSCHRHIQSWSQQQNYPLRIWYEILL